MSAPSQADVLAALQSGSSRRDRPPTTAYPSHADPLSELTSTNGAGPSNNRRLYCYREQCGSLILLPDAAEWIVSESDLIPVESGSPFPKSQPIPTSSTTPTSSSIQKPAGYWHVKGGPMAFENIGYSRPSETLSLPSHAPGAGQGKKVKWLICAECDLGPVGWSFEGGSESWLAADRVRYGERK